MAGRFTEAIRAIDARIGLPMAEGMRLRLLAERERLLRLPTQYPYDRAQAFQQLQRLLPDVTEQEFDELELKGCIDWIYAEGEKRYFVRFHRSLVKTTPDMQKRSGTFTGPARPFLDDLIREMKEKGSAARCITLECSVYISDAAFVPGDYEAWLPYPAECAQQSDIRLLSGTPDKISDAHADARTAHFSQHLQENAPFAVGYSYVSRTRYADPLHAPAPDAPLYPDALPPTADDLAEDGCGIRFTPLLRSLEQELAGGITDPAQKAWAYYCFVTQKVNYRFVRDYFQIDDWCEYCAVHREGDCGLQALLFVTLCRIGGIPARWQSGLSIDDDGAGSHDWAQFWLAGWGWLFCDPSYGGSAWRCGAEERHAFYFGNLEPMRMAANRRFLAEFDPPMQGFRVDPTDSQNGEILCRQLAAEGRFFNGRVKDSDETVVSIEPVD